MRHGDRQAITRAIATSAHDSYSVHMIETINNCAHQPSLCRSSARTDSEEIAKRMDIPVSKVRKILKSRRSRFRWKLHREEKIPSRRFHRRQGVFRSDGHQLELKEKLLV